jgi:hypothetical protein
MKTFLSFGGGVQTTAMLIMISKGRIGADAVIFADTGSEHPETYEYIEKYDKPLCEKIGIPFFTVRMHRKITNVDTKEQEYSDSLRDTILKRHRVPSLYNRWCTEYSKITPIKLFLRNMQKEGKCVKPAVSLIGISLDEKHRAFNKDGTWKQSHHSESRNKYPLVEMNITRNDCLKIIRDYGWPDPVKSGCYFCPFQGGKEWQKLFQNHSDLFWDSVMLEKQDIQYPTYRLYQRMTLKRLASGPGFGHGSMSLFDDYEGGICVEVEASCML